MPPAARIKYVKAIERFVIMSKQRGGGVPAGDSWVKKADPRTCRIWEHRGLPVHTNMGEG